jgi:nitrous oxidase accessory protein
VPRTERPAASTRQARLSGRACLVIALGVLAARGLGAQPSGEIVVSSTGRVRTVAAAIREARPGARIVVRPGLYREPTIIVDKPLTLAGDSGAVLDGEGARQILIVRADDVTVRGLTFRNVGTSYMEDRAAIRVEDVSGCVIEHNRIDAAFFGIYLARVTRCRIASNQLRGTGKTESGSGNGIHLWTSDHITIDDNVIGGHRDGIYLEFVHESTVRGNRSEGNLRYGMHFMYSDGCRYVNNTFRRNGSGVAVMYTRHVEMVGNRFEQNWGSASYGLLLKEILEPVLTGNRFETNSVGLLVDGATHLRATGNTFVGNGWALKLMASTQGATFTGNQFIGNTFDVATNSRETTTTFAGNFWDDYQGYDLDRDGVGDVPHHPVRLFSLLTTQNEPSLIMLRSPFVTLLDAAERVLPALTPETLADARPLMRRPK